MKMRILVTILFLSTLAVLVLEFCKSPTITASVTADNAYVGNITCKTCHQKEHDQWSGSHHYMAMQPASDSTVVGDFNNKVFISDGVNSRFFKKEGKFYINTQGDDGINHDFEVKYIFGFTPLQQYLVQFPGGRMQATRASWDVKQK